MQLTVLGCCGAFPSQGKGTTSYLLQADGFNMVIDMGSGAFVALEKYINPFDVDAVLLSHYHADHIADVGVFQYYRQLKAYPYKGDKPVVPIYGHNQNPYQFKQLTLKGVSQGREFDATSVLTIGPFNCRFMRTLHPVPTYAMRIEEVNTGKVLVFTADSGYLDTFVDFAHDADLFLADTYFLNGNERHVAHFTAKETGELAEKAGVKHIVATHLAEDVDRQLLQVQIEEACHQKIPVHLAEPDAVYMI